MACNFFDGETPTGKTIFDCQGIVDTDRDIHYFDGSLTVRVILHLVCRFGTVREKYFLVGDFDSLTVYTDRIICFSLTVLGFPCRFSTDRKIKINFPDG